MNLDSIIGDGAVKSYFSQGKNSPEKQKPKQGLGFKLQNKLADAQ